MSEVPVVNVEDDEPVAEAVAEPVIEAAAAEPDDSDLAAVDPKDESRVKGIIAALARERAEKRELKKQTGELESLRQYVAAKQPYITVLEQNPDLLKRQPEPAKGEPAPDPDVVAYAQGLQLYKADGSGQLDLDTATRLLAIAEKRAEAKAQQAVQPWQQQTYQSQSAANFQQALQMTDKEGNRANPETLKAVWASMPPEHTADVRVAGMLVAQAFGLDRMMGKTPIKPPAQPALMTEASGGTPRTAAKLTDFERRVIAQRGMKDDTYAKLTEGYKPGRPNIIEED